MEHILNFLSVLIWQGIVVGIIFLFRKELAGLLARIKKVKIGGNTVDFQQPSLSAETVEANIEDATEDLSDEDGFFTSKGVEKVIERSPSCKKDERVIGNLLIFSTPRQRTWLITTNKYIYCVLDGEKTRESGRLLQWRLDLKSARPVEARQKNSRVGLLNIGPRRNWLYSISLFSTPESLRSSVEQIVKEATKGV